MPYENVNAAALFELPDGCLSAESRIYTATGYDDYYEEYYVASTFSPKSETPSFDFDNDKTFTGAVKSLTLPEDGTPVPDLHPTVYPLYVGGVQVTDDNAKDVLGDTDEGAAVSFDAATSTLTLNNANITGVYAKNEGKYNDYYGIYSDIENLKLKLEGSSKIVVNSAEGANSASSLRGFTSNSITVSGSGSLEIKSVHNGFTAKKIVMNSGTITAICDGGSNSEAIDGANITVSGGTLIGETSVSDNSNGYGILAGTLQIDGGRVIGKMNSGQRGHGISANNIIINGGEVTGEGAYSGIFAYALKVTGGTIHAKGDKSPITVAYNGSFKTEEEANAAELKIELPEGYLPAGYAICRATNYYKNYGTNYYVTAATIAPEGSTPSLKL